MIAFQLVDESIRDAVGVRVGPVALTALRLSSMHSMRSFLEAVTILTVVMLGASGPAAAADIFKCPNAAGKIEYRDRPCDGAAGQKIQAKDNSIGNGDDLASIRAKTADLHARQDARRNAEDKLDRDLYEAGERAFQQERVHQDAVALKEAIRESGNAQAAANYNANLVRQRESKVRVEIVNRRKAPTTKSLPAR
jgi:hypothetical protein